MRFLAIVLSSLILGGVCYAQDASTTYQFSDVSQNPFDKDHSPTDPNAFYRYTLGQGNSNMRISSGMSYKEVQGLMKYYQVNSPADLVGKSFSSNLPYNMAMNLMEVQANHDFKYKAPTKDELYQRAVQRLAHLSCPRFDDVDNATSLEAFQVGWGKDEDAYFSKLRDDVAKASDGKVILSEDKSEDHQITCGCIGAKNARITDGISKMELVFSPGGIHPFMCEKKDIVADPNKAIGSSSGAGDDKRVAQNSTGKNGEVVAVQAAPVPTGKVQAAAAQ